MPAQTQKRDYEWLCPQCSSSLTLDNVENLRRGEVVQCPFCGISIGR